MASPVSLTALQIASFCRRPRNYTDISDSLELHISAVMKTISRYPDMFIKRKAKIISREQGAQPIEIEASEHGQSLLNLLK